MELAHPRNVKQAKVLLFNLFTMQVIAYDIATGLRPVTSSVCLRPYGPSAWHKSLKSDYP